MFNKNIKYGIRKLSVGIASVAIGVFLQSNVAHAEEAITTEQPNAFETKAETPTAPSTTEVVATPSEVEKITNTETPVTLAEQPQTTPQAPQPVNQGSVKYRLEGNDQEVELRDFHDNKVTLNQTYELNKEIEIKVPRSVYTPDKKVYHLSYEHNYHNPNGPKLNEVGAKRDEYYQYFKTTLTQEKNALTFQYLRAGSYMVHEFTFVEVPTKLPVNTIGAYNGHSAMTFA